MKYMTKEAQDKLQLTKNKEVSAHKVKILDYNFQEDDETFLVKYETSDGQVKMATVDESVVLEHEDSKSEVEALFQDDIERQIAEGKEAPVIIEKTPVHKSNQEIKDFFARESQPIFKQVQELLAHCQSEGIPQKDIGKFQKELVKGISSLMEKKNTNQIGR